MSYHYRAVRFLYDAAVLGVWRALREIFREFVPNRDVRSVIVQGLGIAALALALGVGLYHRVPASPPWARAKMLARGGDLVGAEEVYWQHLTKGPVTVPLLLDFLDNHSLVASPIPPGERSTFIDPMAGARSAQTVVSEAQIERLLGSKRVPAGTALLARFYRDASRSDDDDPLRREVVARADAEPPMPWANHVLAVDAARSLRLGEAAERFAREGLAFSARRDDALRALHLWLALEDWDTLTDKLAEPRWQKIADASIRHEVALRAGDWKGAAKWLFLANLDPKLGPLLLAGIAAFMWLAFVARLGKVSERRSFRVPMLAAAFVLGVLSIAPTLVLITLEDHFLHLTESGDAVRDAVYYVAGVGLREELAKLLAFAPLMLILSRHGTRLDVLACGAMVGLGFAAEENLNYIAAAGGGAAIGRFLTANFMHMAMTAICADALADFLKAPERRSLEFTMTFLTVVAMHGMYDFFIASPSVGELSFLSSAIFILLTRQFLRAIGLARGRADAGDKLVRRLVQAVLVVLGASFVYVCSEVGPGPAALLLAIGLLGDAIIIYMFVYETRTA